MTLLDSHRPEITESYLLESTPNNPISESDQDTESLASLETDDGRDHPPEKIIAESISYSGSIHYLVKWKDCDILRSSWEKGCFFEIHPRLLEEWTQEKEKIHRGERKPFDINDFNNQVLEVEKRDKERRILRRNRRKVQRSSSESL
ncbi:chromo-domain protein [Blumeria hordei DH14]|uniref:Chromo-domain protein n=1 Tax=Blumeria graminis f. sp. hordei (strain DH14) TaxID=546991 RepID=N1JG66_BLUG1|nr:chromo-domain protein [Blumeria hordei DH14]